MFRTAIFALAAVALTSGTALARQYNRVVTVINATSVDMREFYASSTGVNIWEEDILGQDMLYAGQSLDIDIDDGSGYCMYDVRAVFTDGSEVVDQLNVCEVPAWRVHD